MKTIIIKILTALLYCRLTPLEHIAEGTHQDATSRYLEADLTQRYSVMTQGTAAHQMKVCGVADLPLGVCADEGKAGDLCALQNLGGTESTRLGVASEIITPGGLLIPAASGQIRNLPSDPSAGTYYIIGQHRAGGAAIGELVEFDPCVPQLLIIPSGES
jgi:hypothetical protein